MPVKCLRNAMRVFVCVCVYFVDVFSVLLLMLFYTCNKCCIIIVFYMGLPIPRPIPMPPPAMGGSPALGLFIVSSTDRIMQAASAAADSALILIIEGSQTHCSKLSEISSLVISTPYHWPPAKIKPLIFFLIQNSVISNIRYFQLLLVTLSCTSQARTSLTNNCNFEPAGNSIEKCPRIRQSKKYARTANWCERAHTMAQPLAYERAAKTNTR